MSVAMRMRNLSSSLRLLAEASDPIILDVFDMVCEEIYYETNARPNKYVSKFKTFRNSQNVDLLTTLTIEESVS